MSETASPAAATAPATRWLVVAVLVGTGIMAAGHLFKMSPAMPLVRQELDLGLVGGGWLFSIFNVTAMVVGAIAGSTADRFGYRRVLVSGLLTLATASAIGAFATSVPVLMLCRFAEGVGFLSVVVAAPSLIAREALSKSHRSRALALWSIYNPAGGALILVFAPLILMASGWRVLWLLLAGLSLAVCLFLWLARPRAGPTRPQSPAPVLRSLQQTVKSRGAWIVAAAFGFYTLQYVVLMTWLVTYLVENQGIGVATAGLLTAVVIASNIIGNLLAGMLLVRGFAHGTIIMLTAVLMAAAAAVIFSGSPDPVRYAACVMLSLTGGMIPGAALAAVPMVSPSEAQIGTVNGLVVQGSNAGLVAGAPLAAAIVTATGTWGSLLGLFLVAGSVVLVSGLCLNRWARYNRR